MAALSATLQSVSDALVSSQPPDANVSEARVTRSSLKRKHSDSLRELALITPPASAQHSEDDVFERNVAPILPLGLHVLATEAAALSHIHHLYATDAAAQDSLLRAVHVVQAVNQKGGKLVICGVGKSGLVGSKTVASLKSLGLAASFLHAAEALHGDLGDVRPHDAIMFISFSGKTAELLQVLSHLPPTVPVLALTGTTERSACPLLHGRDAQLGILLPAPIPTSELTSFGVAAPTTSTTVAIAVGDMLAITSAERVHGGAAQTKAAFAKNHPGGAIGAAHAATGPVKRSRRKPAFEDETPDEG